jgi:NADH dehydrogenase
VRFHQRLVNRFIRADAQLEPVRKGQLHVTIIGAGATGTELAAELHRTTRQVVAYGLNRIDPDKELKITLLDVMTMVQGRPALSLCSVSSRGLLGCRAEPQAKEGGP